MRILALSGSIRSKSANRSLLLAAKFLAPREIEIILFEGISSLPYFNPDLDGDVPRIPGVPQSSLLEVLKTMSAQVVPSAMINIPGIRSQFDTHTGQLKDPAVSKQIQSAIEALARHRNSLSHP